MNPLLFFRLFWVFLFTLSALCAEAQTPIRAKDQPNTTQVSPIQQVFPIQSTKVVTPLVNGVQNQAKTAATVLDTTPVKRPPLKEKYKPRVRENLSPTYQVIPNAVTISQVVILNQKIADANAKIAQLPPNVREQFKSDFLQEGFKIESISEKEWKRMGVCLDAINNMDFSRAINVKEIANNIAPIDSVLGTQVVVIHASTNANRPFRVSAIDLVGNPVQNVKYYWITDIYFNQIATYDCEYPTCDFSAINALGTKFTGKVSGSNCHFFAVQLIDGRNEIVGYDEVTPKETKLVMLLDIY